MPVYAHGEEDPRNQPGDIDADNISNKDDVCIKENYNDSFHRHCLQKAGLNFTELFTEQQISILLYFAPNYSSTINLLASAAASDQYQRAAIRTCDDLESFESNNRQVSKVFRNTARLATWLGVIIAVVIGIIFTPAAGGGTAAAAATIVAALHLGADIYGNMADAADNAYEQLCTPQYR